MRTDGGGGEQYRRLGGGDSRGTRERDVHEDDPLHLQRAGRREQAHIHRKVLGHVQYLRVHHSVETPLRPANSAHPIVASSRFAAPKDRSWNEHAEKATSPTDAARLCFCFVLHRRLGKDRPTLSRMAVKARKPTLQRDTCPRCSSPQAILAFVEGGVATYFCPKCADVYYGRAGISCAISPTRTH